VGQLGGIRFRRQAPIGAYIADFACHKPRIVVECDGGQHAESAHDVARDTWLRRQGYLVLRFWNGEIIDHPEAVEFAILRALERR
jgi:very-short-patch-repair endonuclease